MKFALVGKFMCMAICYSLSFTAIAEDETHHRIGFNGALTSSDSWQLEFSYHYMFNRYIGLGGSMGSWQVWYEYG